MSSPCHRNGCSFDRGFSSAVHTSDFQLGGGSALRDDISHPSALLPLLQHSKQLQPATLSLILSFKPLSQGFQQGHKFFSGQSCFLLPFKAWLCFATGPFERWKEKAAAKPSACTWKEEDIQEHKIADNSILPSPLPSSTG